MIYEILEQIKNTNSINEKVKILEENKDNELLKKVLFYTYNLYNYYIKKIPQVNSHKGELTLEDTFELLDDLRNKKITGNEARDAVAYMLMKLDEKDANVFERILKKDLKIGINKKLINKVWNIIPEIPYKGARPYNKKDLEKLLQKDYLYAEIKYDGEFVNIINDGNSIKTISRNGKDIYLEHLFNIPNNWVLTGELLIRGVDRYTSNGIINSLKTINEKIKTNTITNKDIDKFVKQYGKLPNEFEKDIYVVVWDCIPYENWINGKWIMELENRRKFLKTFIDHNIYMVEYKIVKTEKEIFDYYKEVLNRGEEGIILKDPKSEWKDGKNGDWLKFKNEIELDLRIIGYKYGNLGTKYENKINRLILETEDKKLQTIASGINEDIMEIFTNEKDNLIGKIATIKCNGISKDKEGNYSCLHPRFIKIRDDKEIANTLEECFEIEGSINA